MLHGQDPLWWEDEAVIGQVAFFSGCEGAGFDYFHYRPLTAFFATLLTPAVGTIKAALLVNWLAWALCAWATWRLSLKLFDDGLAALFAVIFVSAGIGIVYHIGDYSAHLPAFAGYYLGVFLLYDSGILFRRKPWQTHLFLGAFLALVCFVYSWYAIMLLEVYILSAFRHNRWYHVTGAVALALTTFPLWRVILHLMAVEITTGQEQFMAIDALSLWWEIFKNPSLEALEALGGRLCGIGIFDSPVVIILGILSCLLLPRNGALHWFGLLVLGIPFLATFIVLPNSDMRGYLTYGATIWIYCWLGRFLALGLRGRPSVQIAAGLAFLVAGSTHIAWSTAHFWGWLGPVKSFIEGWDYGKPYFMHPRPTVLSMSGLERPPIFFGGDASLEAAGAYVADPLILIEPSAVSWLRAFGNRALFFGYLALFAMAAVHCLRRRLLVAAGVIFLAVASSGFSCLTFRATPNVVDIYHSPQVTLDPGAKFSYRLDLSPLFLDTLKKEIEAEDQLDFFVGFPFIDDTGRSSVEIFVAAGPLSIPVKNSAWKVPGLNPYANPSYRDWDGACWALDPQVAIAALNDAGHVTVEVTNHLQETIWFSGWQRHGLPGRQLVITASEGTNIQTP
ncbi:MAG TPA: hypothetical protein VGY77_10205, partial [Gemmataceae bacterium]|nr:hypothetical protein [Gemmataceae bacterium]